MTAMTISQYNIYDAKTQFSQLVERAANGETILIARNGRPLAALTPIIHDPQPARVREFGFMRDKWPPFTDEEWAESDRYVTELFDKIANEEI